MEKDDELHGSTGTSYDFGARLYDPRVGRWASIDPSAPSFPQESPYSFAGASPIVLSDGDGRKKTYYLTLIAADGTRTDLVIVNKSEIAEVARIEAYRFNGITYYSDVLETQYFDIEQRITLNMQTGELVVGEEELVGEPRSEFAWVRGLADNIEQFDNFLNGGGGILFTSTEGQGQESRSGYNADEKSENIDLLMAVIDMAKTTAGVGSGEANAISSFLQGFGEGLSTIQALKTAEDETPGAIDEVLDLIGPPKPTRATCDYCNGDTIPIEDTVRHSGPFKQVP